MKKLGIFVDSLKRDGAERVSVNLANYMINQSIEVTIITEWISENEYDIPEGIKRISINSKGKKYLKYLYNVLKMRKALVENGVDTLLVMDVPACLIAIPASRGIGIKVVVSERNDPVHFPGKRIVAKVSRWLMSKADGFVFQTVDAKEFYYKICKGRGVIIPNPLFIKTLPIAYTGEREKIIVSAGRLTKQKNQKLLIDAFCKFNDKVKGYELWIYGEGILKNDLIQYTYDRGIADLVNFPGNKVDLLERIKKATMFVMTSNFEGMPNALLEAMAIGLPVVSSDCPCGGPRAVIDQNINGVLFDVGDSSECANAMIKIALNKTLAKNIANNALNIRKQLDSELISKKWKEYLENL